ncbi:MAG: hypothetical protein H6810_00830 [Phycisphaeraceae bacterium]|nr:MAG: hypothetical protein H6810_00830 [Phycisphaeraceae bacterium]
MAREASHTEAELLARAEAGDREAVAALVRLHEPLIRARFRASFERQERSLFDSSDFMATMLRRMDWLVSTGALGGDALDLRLKLHEIMLDAIGEYARALGHERELTEDIFAPAAEGECDERGVVAQAVKGLDVTDRVIVFLRARGLKHKVIASALGLRTPAVRMRWIRLQEQLRSVLH